MLKMSIFHRRLNDLFLLMRRVIILDTAADEAWAQGQISRYPGWYSQILQMNFRQLALKTTGSSTAYCRIFPISRSLEEEHRLTV